MNPLHDLLALRDALLSATDFEAAAERLLDVALEVCTRELATLSSPRPRLLRGMVHLRPDGAYRSLVVVECEENAHDHDALLPSLTVWSVVERHALPVEVDVKLGRAMPLDGQPEELRRRDPRTDDVFASRHRLLERSATHILALPLRLRDDRIDGMISIELEATTLIGQSLLVSRDAAGRELVERLQLMADMAAQMLVSLPLGHPTVGEVVPDELLPVIGPSMQGTMRMLQIFSRQEETLLLCGPTGSGKSRLARWCHSQSQRANGPFESVDLLTIPDDMQMAELFGWRRGAFTGAVSDHLGMVARAEGGTLFIDEVDKLSLKAQAGLLRFLEARRYRRLGDPGGDYVSDVRVIVGTNAELPRLVADGRFREDLFYRIAVVQVALPPLKDRKDEIAGWADFMARRRHAESHDSGTARISAAAGVALTTYEWPGNLRQLDNAIRRAYVIADSERNGTASSEPDVELTSDHINRAMSFERSVGQMRGVLDTLRQAAMAFAAEASQRRAGTLDGLNLDLVDGFRGMVLIAGLRVCGGDKEETVRLFDKASMLAGRNHYKLFKREAARVRALYDALGEPPDDDLPGLDD